MKNVVLASGSSRRKRLLRQILGDNFKVHPSSYEEEDLDLKPSDLVRNHSVEKARDVAENYSNAIVMGGDTVVGLECKVLGKPRTEENSKKMLKMISGKKVNLLSGIDVVDTGSGKEVQKNEKTKVKMKEMSEREIEGYVSTGEPLDKAGAFAIQGKGSVLVEWIEGSYYNVVGLPLFRLSQILREFGVKVLDSK